MTLIDRYVENVISYLPEGSRSEIKLELTSNIWGMLPEEPNESQIVAVLESLGNPKLLAKSYQPTNRYLIGPTVYEKYIYTMKLVLPIIAVTLTIISLISWVFSSNAASAGEISQSIKQLFIQLIASVFSGTLQVGFWITFGFVMVERYGTEKESKEKNTSWQIKDLPETTYNKKNHISRFETTTSIIGKIVFATIIYMHSTVAKLFFFTYGQTQIVYLFAPDVFSKYVFAILSVIALSTLLRIYMLIKEYWTTPMAIIKIFVNISSIVVLAIMSRDARLINPDLIKLAQERPYLNWLSNLPSVILVLFIIFAIWDIVSGFKKSGLIFGQTKNAQQTRS